VVANWVVNIPQLAGIQFSGLVTLGSGARQDVGTHPRFGGVPDSTYFPAAFQPPQRNFLIFGGWAYRRVDMRLRKDFPEIHGTSIGVTVDVFNVLNSMNFTNYPFAIPTPNPNHTFLVGQPTDVLSDPRRVQIGVEYNF
jgi:hypothetical protein